MNETRDRGKRQAKRLIRSLYSELGKSPKTMKALTEEAGLDRGYPARHANAGTMELRNFCTLVATTGEDFVDFVARSLGGAPSSLQLIKQPGSEEPSILEKARSRILQKRPGTIPRAHLERLDDLRYDDPAKARERIEMAIEDVDPEEVPFALGVYASCCRPLLLFDEAWHAISTGIVLARQVGQPWARANLFQRASIVRYVSNENELALATSEWATIQYARLGDQVSVTRTLVDQGPILWRLERYAEAESAFRTALASLPADATRNRWACYLALALIPYFRGQHSQALAALETARPLARSIAERGKIQWLEACCLAQLDRIEEALRGFDAGFSLLATTVPTDAALLVCDRVHHLLRWGRNQEAHDGARALQPLIFHLTERSKTLAAAARELAMIESKTQSALTLEMVRAVKARIEEASGNEPAGLRQPRRSRSARKTVHA